MTNQPKIRANKAYQIARMYLNWFIEDKFTGIQVADYGLTKEFRLKGVKQMRKSRRFLNSNDVTILVSGYDELGNECVLTSDLLYYNLDTYTAR